MEKILGICGFYGSLFVFASGVGVGSESEGLVLQNEKLLMGFGTTGGWCLPGKA